VPASGKKHKIMIPKIPKGSCLSGCAHFLAKKCKDTVNLPGEPKTATGHVHEKWMS
jgi:hypothetical protein